jgi:hypothetical protein
VASAALRNILAALKLGRALRLQSPLAAGGTSLPRRYWDIPLPPDRSLELMPEELRRRQMAAVTNSVIAAERRRTDPEQGRGRSEENELK